MAASAGRPGTDRAGRRPRWAVALPAAAVVAAIVVAFLALGDADHDPDGAGASGTASSASLPADAVAVSSDAPAADSLAELVDGADLVVRAEVVATERGRWFGDGGDGARIQSRLVTLRVTDVLAGRAPAAPTLLVEEEGWLEDGAPLVVDGAAPSRVGDEGVWFLVDGGDPELGAYVVVGVQGRYLVAGPDGELDGAAGGDPLVRRLAALTVEELAKAVGAS